MKSSKSTLRLLLILIVFANFVALAHKTIPDDEDEMEGQMRAEEGNLAGEAIIDDMGEVVEENG